MSMEPRQAVRFLFAAAVLVALASCAGSAGAIPGTLTPAEYFQRAQDAAEASDYPRALQYYRTFQEKFPQDSERGTWASYEIALLYHKMGDDKECVALLDELLARYAKGEQLPDAPRILAQKVKERLQAPAPAR